MKRSEVHKLLGAPAKLRSRDPEDPAITDTEWYWLSSNGKCGNAPHNVLELAFPNDRVTGFRCVSQTLQL